eukprot:scaffold86193_cov24-Tisochrysis_lutea.AAC.3
MHHAQQKLQRAEIVHTQIAHTHTHTQDTGMLAEQQQQRRSSSGYSGCGSDGKCLIHRGFVSRAANTVHRLMPQGHEF